MMTRRAGGLISCRQWAAIVAMCLLCLACGGRPAGAEARPSRVDTTTGYQGTFEFDGIALGDTLVAIRTVARRPCIAIRNSRSASGWNATWPTR